MANITDIACGPGYSQEECLEMLSQAAMERFNQEQIFNAYISLVATFILYGVFILWIRHRIKGGKIDRKSSLSYIAFLSFIWTRAAWEYFSNPLWQSSIISIPVFIASILATVYLIYLHSRNRGLLKQRT